MLISFFYLNNKVKKLCNFNKNEIVKMFLILNNFDYFIFAKKQKECTHK